MEGDFPVELMQNSFVQEPLSLSKPRVGASTNDQRFLLVFILGTYFGPDMRDEIPRKSALQREAEQLPPYTSDMLAGSVCKLSEIESVYYYLLRNSHPSAKVKLQSLYKFLQGHLAPPVKETLEDDRQFPSFFPPHLHRHARYKGTYKVVENVVFIDDPYLPATKLEDVERFKRLSGLMELSVERDEARGYQHGLRTDRDEERQARFDIVCEAGQAGGPFLDGLGVRKKRKKKGQMDFLPPQPVAAAPIVEKAPSNPKMMDGPAMMLLPTLLTLEQWNDVVNAAKPAIVFTGTAAARQAGPLIGLVDIGVSDDAYLFRTALPGVKKEEADFKCEVEGDGKVTIKGSTTTGEARVFRGQRVFNMVSQFLCPPGLFTVSFRLPGAVEPTQFTGTFGSDGILEGIKTDLRSANGWIYLSAVTQGLKIGAGGQT
ncbi:hypothetical protein R1flu_023457 [Riccia fluitans]|uniref:SHSP domain-containing protein n=1 Tax=Riccia fluitans TaxID=41844 RepID=A0ABD1XS25_9MARC